MDNNFDWFVGTWTSKQRRLREMLAGCDDWYEFPGTHRSWSVLDGVGNSMKPSSQRRGLAL